MTASDRTAWIFSASPAQTRGFAAGLALLGATGLATAQEQVNESRWLRNIHQLTRSDMGLDKAGEAYFSADGKRICFQAFPKGENDYQIYVMNIDGSGLQMVSTGKGATTCSYFSPDGRKLLFASNHLDPRPVAPPESASQGSENSGGRNYQWSFFPGMDIYEYTFADKSLKPLVTAPGYDAEGSYSPDGKLIVFTSMRDGDQEIYICDADGKNPRRITNAKGYDGGPFFAPDGKRIVYRSDRKGDGNLQIFTNNLEGTAEKQLTDNEFLNWCPYWHPSGRWLIFNRSGVRWAARFLGGRQARDVDQQARRPDRLTDFRRRLHRPVARGSAG